MTADRFLSDVRALVRLGDEEEVRVVAASLRARADRALLPVLDALEEVALQNARQLQEVVHIHEGDRRLMLVELHDRLSGPMARLHLLVEELTRTCAGPDAQRVLRHSEAVMEALQRFLGEQRTVEEGGDAVQALRAWIDDFSAEADIHVECELPDDLGQLSSVRSLFLVRIVQEALTNVLRHARSRDAAVRIRRQDGAVLGVVSDAGPARGNGRTRRGFGLRGMEERVRFLGGRFEFESHPDGTTVRFEIPGF